MNKNDWSPILLGLQSPVWGDVTTEPVADI